MNSSGPSIYFLKSYSLKNLSRSVRRYNFHNLPTDTANDPAIDKGRNISNYQALPVRVLTSAVSIHTMQADRKIMITLGGQTPGVSADFYA